MPILNTRNRWGAVQQLFHWTIVVLVITQFVLANRADALPDGMQKLAVLANHKSFGVTILVLAILRIIWRHTAGPRPQLPDTMRPWERALARFSHVALYALLFAVPLAGWTMSSAKNYPVSWFGQFQLPDLVGPSERVFEIAHGAHGTLALSLALVALLHLAGALKHHFIRRDNVLKRMLPFTRT